MGAPRTGKTKKEDSRSTAHGRPKVEWRGYVTYEISEEVKKTLSKFVSGGNDPVNWLPEIALDGTYEIKTKWDGYNNCWVSNIYCAKYGHVNAGWSLPCRAADYWDSLRRVAFIHIEVLQRNWGVGEQKASWDDDKW